MPATTTNLGYPYPIPTDTVDVPRDMSALATSVDRGLNVRTFADLVALRAWSAPHGAIGITLDTNGIWMHDGTGWRAMAQAPVSFTTSWTSGITPGDGTWATWAQRQAGTLYFWARFTFGASTVLTGTPKLQLPVAPGTFAMGQLMVTFKSGVDGGLHVGTHTDEVPPGLYAVKTDTPTAEAASLTPTVPFAWGVGAVIHVSGRYPMLDPYAVLADEVAMEV